ncbi:MFS transporter [Weissella minor]|uniref:Integral membrane protein n=1 Tax=Weissella minor TaxID=1620 RepID=A0A0R2JF96_9LACO|nr:MFS transporter [Weissella minor]KRN76046.1 integral membrane protein [Weissella minor]
MHTLIKNRTFLTLSTSNFFQTLGISFFNIILLMFAKSFDNAQLWVALISISAVIPGVLSAVLGNVVNRFNYKAKSIIILTIIQAVMYLYMAVYMDHKYTWVIMMVIGVNLLSDIFGVLIGLLRYPIIQAHIEGDNRRQALGIMQSIAFFMQPIGQAAGVAYIGATGDYRMGSLINAATFLISALIFVFNYKQVEINPTTSVSDQPEPAQTSKEKAISLKKVLALLTDATKIPGISLLASLMIFNGISAGIDGVLNLYVLDHSDSFYFSFGVSIFLITIASIAGQIVGSFWVNDFMKNYTMKKLLLISAVLLILLFVVLALQMNFLLILLLLFAMSYIIGKVNPKVASDIMEKVDEKYLSPMMGTISTVMTLATPVGSVALVAGYAGIGPTITLTIGIGFAAVSFLILLFAKKID